MRRLGKTYESKVYVGAGHGFFCDERRSYHPDAARGAGRLGAWAKLTGWFGKYLK